MSPRNLGIHAPRQEPAQVLSVPGLSVARPRTSASYADVLNRFISSLPPAGQAFAETAHAQKEMAYARY